MGKLNIKVNEKFGLLQVVNEVERIKLPSGQYNRAFLCKCECGNKKIVRLLHLVRGRIQSCGICQIKNDFNNPKLYRVWKSMNERCYLETYNRSHRYKGRNIIVCDEWKESYKSFKRWALKNGYSENLRIDRIDNNGNYEPFNCRFVTNKENANNREITFRVNYNGELVAFMLLMERLGIDKTHYPAIRERIKRGWDHEKAINQPIKNGNYKKRNVTQTA